MGLLGAREVALTAVATLLNLLVLIGVIGGIVYLVRSGRGGARAGAEETPLHILQKRYARGELTREQYHEMKRELSE